MFLYKFKQLYSSLVIIDESRYGIEGLKPVAKIIASISFSTVPSTNSISRSLMQLILSLTLTAPQTIRALSCHRKKNYE